MASRPAPLLTGAPTGPQARRRAPAKHAPSERDQRARSGRDQRAPDPRFAARDRRVQRLFARHLNGDPTARETLVRELLPLAHQLARRYTRSREPMEDLKQVASLGLLKAIDRYDPSHQSSFVSFAVPTILGELRRHFRDCTWAVHVPRGAQERSKAIEATIERLTNERGSAPTVQEIAIAMELNIEDVVDGLLARRAYEAGPLERRTPRDDGEAGMSVLDVVGEADERYRLVEEHATMLPALRTLSDRERRVLRMRYFEELSQREIATRIGVSQMQVSRILSGIVTKVRRLACPAGR
jgi:RNA polymerase sigma-B factor